MSREYLNTELSKEEIEQLKKEISFNDAAKRKDTVILIVLLVIGILGLSIVLFSGGNSNFSENSNTHITDDNAHVIKKSAKTFDVSGTFVTDDPIIINIKDYNEENVYLVNFGDQTQTPYNSSIITHKYRKKGKYKLTILNTETYVVESKVIFIHDDQHNFASK